MKILSYLPQHLLLLSLCLATVLSMRDAPAALIKNQVSTFPNTYEAPTMSKQIESSDYRAPALSKALLETDPTRKMRKPDFIENLKYALYQMTRGEAEQIFTFVDQNKDDMIDHTEWDAFVTLFILPFEACDANKNYVLELNEFQNCFESDPKTKLITFRRRYEDQKHRIMINCISNRGAEELNFAEYLFVRKALFGWKQCHSNAKYIARSHFKCAMGTAIPQKYYARQDVENIYQVGLRASGDRNLIELDFVSYLRTLYFTYFYGVFNMPNDTVYLEKQQFIKAVKEDRLPNNFEESEINAIYDLVNNSPTMTVNKVSSIDFDTFVFFYGHHRRFSKYSQAKPLQLSLEEFQKMLNDSFMNKEVLMAVDDSFTRFTEANYQEASLVLQKYRLNEKDFFFARFKQDASATTHSTNNDATINANYYSLQPNMANREVFFSTFVDTNKNYWTKLNMYRAFQLANLYIALTDYTPETQTRNVAASTFVEKLPTTYDTVRPAINMKQRSNYVIYKALPRTIEVDILTFLSLENFFTKFQIQTMSSNVNVEETKVKIVLKDFGMDNMPDTVLDISGKGYDQLHRRTFVPLDLAKNCAIVHSVASEKLRNARQVKNLKLKVNTDESRLFPGPNRKFMSSDKA